MTIRFAIAGTVLAVASALVATMPSSAVACTGGGTLDGTLATTRGGVLRAQVVAIEQVSDPEPLRLTLTNLVTVAGLPPLAREVVASAVAPCEQAVHPGDTVLLLFEVVILDGPFPVPLYYVIEGADAPDPAVVAAALRQLPATDAVVPGMGAPPPVAPLLVAGFLGALLGWRRGRAGSRSGR